ncbi:MAG: hypothetical protein FJX23_07230, partial [Alphaproteobacteria bacterium]|nr:hypothetical protein [Alphaproteobacteria bacterium]
MNQHGQEPQLHNPDAPHEPISKWNPAFLLATWFGCGKIRPAPGTWGSLGALPFAYAIHTSGGAQMLLI